MFFSVTGSGGCGVHVAEQTLRLPEGDATSSVTHLWTEEEDRGEYTQSGFFVFVFEAPSTTRFENLSHHFI